MARKLEKTEWSSFLDRFDKGLSDVQAEIEVASLNLGDQIQAEWVPLIGEKGTIAQCVSGRIPYVQARLTPKSKSATSTVRRINP